MGLTYYVEGNRDIPTVLHLNGNFIYRGMCLTLMVQAVESLTAHHDAEHFRNKALFQGLPSMSVFSIWHLTDNEARGCVF